MAQQNNKKKQNYDFYEKKKENRKQEKHNKNYMLSLHKYIYFGFFSFSGCTIIPNLR